MSSVASPESDLQAIFERRIRPVVFAHGPSAADPELILATGQFGVGPARAFGGLVDGREIAALGASDLRAFHPRYLELSRSRSAEASLILTESTSGWMRSALQYARTTRRSLLLEAQFLPESDGGQVLRGDSPDSATFGEGLRDADRPRTASERGGVKYLPEELGPNTEQLAVA